MPAKTKRLSQLDEKPAKHTPKRHKGILVPPVVKPRILPDGTKTRPPISIPRMRATLYRWAGNMAEAARELGVSRQAVHDRVQKSPELQAWLVEIKTSTHDFVENEIIKAIAAGDGAMMRWFADRQMRDRGYGHFVAHEDVTEPDPVAQQAAQEMITFFHNEMERRYRAGEKAPLLIEAKPK